MTKKNNVKDFCCFSVYLLIEVQVISSVLFAIVVMGVVAVVEVRVVAVVVVEGFFLVTFGFLGVAVVVIIVVAVVVSFCASVYQQ